MGCGSCGMRYRPGRRRGAVASSTPTIPRTKAKTEGYMGVIKNVDPPKQETPVEDQTSQVSKEENDL